ncbi:type II toxin-antitoxin system RelE/ParE family toxin [Ponticaulis profundi]|uniref:Type II toxin-antitoxin system RelE/ParE family toxin n=1 Tax=Ponticaulis profundi TaxID=2665222 RepID=A0ABW1S6K8_9PROT
MIKVEQTQVFSDWLTNLKDVSARARIITRIQRIAASGSFGDVEPVGEGVSELRFHIGPGYRVYFIQRGSELVLLLAGGTKKSQRRDIRKAKELAAEL